MDSFSDDMSELGERPGFGDLGRRSFWLDGGECNSRCCYFHPSFGILKFWQGTVEIIVRLLSAGLSGFILLPALWILLSLDIPETGEESVDKSLSESRKVLTWVILSAAVGLLVQLLIIIGRFMNIELTVSFNSLFRVLDVVANVVFTSAFFTLCFPLFVFTKDLLELMESYPHSDFASQFPALRRSYLATATLCCLACVQHFVLSVWMSIFLSFRWDGKLRRYLQLPSQDTPTPSPQAV